jgi:hypothetical protein
MKIAIFASRSTSTSPNSRELKRFETPDEANADCIALAYVSELAEQGWSITNVSPVDANGYPLRTQQAINHHLNTYHN